MRRVAGGTRWTGPLQTGADTGATATSTIGRAIMTQTATVQGNSSGATNIVLPANCEVLRLWMVPVCAASAASSVASQGINFRVGRAAGNDAYFGTIKASGVTTIYDVGVDALNRANASGASWINITSATQVFIDATAVTSVSALAEFAGRVHIDYFER